MEGFGQPENTKERRPWTTEMMKENRDKWNLAADVGVLEYLQEFGNTLLNETETTINLLDSFEAELNTSCVQVSNITNRFLSLADSQFVENRVYDDEETPTPENATAMPSEPVKTKQEIDREIFNRLKESINNGLNVLNTKFETVEVTNSDSEDDDSSPTGVVYKPINPFNSRPLPHLIGSVDFMKDPTLGLEEPLTEDEEESVEESSSDSKELMEENEDSEPESDRPNLILPKENRNEESDILFKQPSSSFADHLAKRLESMEKESVVVEQPKQTRNLFSTTPPPLDDSCEDDDDFGSNNDLMFGGSRNKTDNRNASSDDLFAPKSKSGFWNDDNDNITTQDNYNHKKVMEDLEKRLSRSSKNDDYDDLSPSPPPLNDQITSDIHDGSNKMLKKKDSSIFDDYNDNLNENDSNDLFSSKNVSSSSSSSSTKKHVPAGAVSVLGGILKDKHIDIKKQKQNNNKLFKSSSSINEESIKNDNAIIAKSITSLRRNYDDNDDDNDDDEANNCNENKLNDDDDDSLFKSSNYQEKSSSRSSSVKLSESLQDDNLSIKSNKSAGLFDDVLVNTTKKNTIKKTMDDLFRDLNDNGDDDDDDLFSSNVNVTNINKTKSSNSNLFPSSNKSDTNYTSSIFGNKSTVDDLFSDIGDKDDLFSNFVDSKNKEILSETKINKSINNLKNDSVINTNIKKPNNKPISLFDDDDDDDGIDSFDSGFLTTNKNISSSNDSKRINNKTTKEIINGDKPVSVPSLSVSASTGRTVKKSSSLFDNKGIDLFGDNINDEDDDLFSSDIFSKKSTVNKNISDENNDTLFSSSVKNKNASPLQSSYDDNVKKLLKQQNENDSLVNKNINEENKLVGSSESMSDKILAVPNKIIKTANVKSLSLFSDDVNNDDLFSNNNNMSKIPEIKDDTFNTASSTSKEGIEKVDKKQLSSEVNDKLSLIVNDNSEADFKSKNILQNKTLNEEDNDLFKKSDYFSSKSDTNKTKSEPLLDDSPLFNDDKFIKKSADKLVTQGGGGVDNSDDNLFGKSTDDSKINVIINSDNSDKVSSKIVSDELFSTNTDINSKDMFMNSEPVVKQLDSEDLIDKKTADSVPSIFNKTSENLPNVDLVSDKCDVISSTDIESSLETDVNKKLGNDNCNSSFDNKIVTTDNDSSENVFDVNKSLPKIPSVANIKPQIPVKPTKPQPPKSLNIRAPISSPDPFGDMIKNKSSTSKSLDIPDGCVFSSDSSSTISPRITPGKLNLEKTLNIDPKALLPGARPASFKRSSNSGSVIKENDDESLKSSSGLLFNNENVELNDDKTSDKEDKMSSLPNTKDTQPVLHSIAKDRAKIQVKRRPQTRKARREAIRQSTIENNNDDETDNSSSITTTTTTQSVKEQKSTSSSLFEQTSNILSPSTDEEDLFGVPPLDLPPDYSKVSTSPGDIFDAPTIISPGLNTSIDDAAASVRTVSSTIIEGDDDDKSKKDNNIVNNLSGSKNDDFEDGVCDKNSDIVIEPPPLLNDSDYDDNDVKDVGKSFKNHPDELFSDINNITADESEDIFKDNFIKLNKDVNENKGTDFSTSNKSLPTIKSNSDLNLFDDNDDDTDLFLNKKSSVSDKVNVISDSILKDNTNKDIASTDLVKPDPANIICGVFNTGVNICDKLSITPPNDDELFPPSDWTLNNSNKDNATIISVPEKIKTDSLFNDNISDDNLFSSSSLNTTIGNARSSNSKVNSDKGISNMEKKNIIKKPVAGDLFANDDDDDDDDNLFGEVKTKKESKSSLNKLKTTTDSKIKKPMSVKTKSLFDEDDNDDDDEIDIFSSSIKNRSSLTKNRSNDEVKSSGLIKKIGSNVKSSVKVTTTTTTSKTTPQDGFIDPLMALEKNTD